MKKELTAGKIGGVVLVLLVLMGLVIRLPYYIESPGSALRLDDVVEVNSESDDEPGSYMLTTVSIHQATPLTYFTRYLPFHDGVTEEELFGSTSSNQEYNTLQEYYMTSSINSAIQVAYEAAGAEYTMNYEGVYVMSVLEDSNFEGELLPGDTIVSVDGQTFESSQEFIDYVQNQTVGEEIEVTYRRDGEENTVVAPLMEMEETGAPGLGIALVDNTTIETGIPVSIDSGRIGGPSAGFMFALQIYTLLVEEDIRQGLEVAGTGTIASDGTVGRIGGIDKKVVAASEEGADVFFAPEDELDPVVLENYPDLRTNYEEAVEAAEEIDTDMEIVPVKTLQDALDYLESH